MYADRPIVRLIGIAPAGLNGSMLVFEDNTVFGITAEQRDFYNPKPGDLFTLFNDGSFVIRESKG